MNPSIVLYGAGKAKLEDRPIPKISDPNDVIIRMNYVGVCGSDVHFWVDGGMGDKMVTPDAPLTMGHEGCGTIEEIGSKVTNLRVGDRVAIEPGRPCRVCDRCKEGSYHLCPHMEFAACPPDTPGLLSKFWRSPSDFCYKLPAHISVSQGIFAEPLAVAAHAVRMVDVRPGDKLVVFGAGTIGLLSAAVARYFGAKTIVAVDVLDHKLDMAKQFNGSEVFKPDLSATPRQNAARLVEQHKLGAGADKIIEATGAESSINTAIHVARLGCHMIQTGVGRPDISFPMTEFTSKEIHLHGACRYGYGDYKVAMDVLENNFISVDMLISNTFPFEKTTDAWEATRRGEGIKNIICVADG